MPPLHPMQEMADEEEASRPKQMEQVDIDDLLDDPELQRLHADRIAAMKQEAEKRAELERKGHGTYTEIEEGEFLEVVGYGVVHAMPACGVLLGHVAAQALQVAAQLAAWYGRPSPRVGACEVVKV